MKHWPRGPKRLRLGLLGPDVGFCVQLVFRFMATPTEEAYSEVVQMVTEAMKVPTEVIMGRLDQIEERMRHTSEEAETSGNSSRPRQQSGSGMSSSRGGVK